MKNTKEESGIMISQNTSKMGGYTHEDPSLNIVDGNNMSNTVLRIGYILRLERFRDHW